MFAISIKPLSFISVITNKLFLIKDFEKMSDFVLPDVKEGIENLGKITKHGPKELSQEVLFSPLKSETKRIQRLPKIPTEKFEGIHISEFMVEAQLPGREYDKATIQYITELMREAHKRKVPIILGPEATATFHNLNMEKKITKIYR